MSEYQCYEFLAIDRPLSPKQQGELRDISTRAEISSTRFWNEYQWGDLKADPGKLLLKYFDVHHYFANWGSRVLMVRLPAAQVDLAKLKPYFSGHGAKVSKAGKYLVTEFWANDDEPRDEEPSDGGQFAELVPVRGQLLQGDLRAAYLGWLAGVDRGADDDDIEPPVPAGLATLDGPLQALAELLGLDESLLAAAAEASAGPTFDLKSARAWLKEQPASTKERLLLRAMEDPSFSVGGELLSDFRATDTPSRSLRRTVAQLRERAAALA